MTMRQFIKKLFVTIIMIGIVLAAVLKVGYILICKVIVVIIFVVLAIQYWVGEDRHLYVSVRERTKSCL